MTNNLDIFNLNIEDFKAPEKKKKASDLYLTDPKLAKDSVYTATIRFLFNIKDPKKSMIKHSQYWLEDKDHNIAFSASCPSSIGENSIIGATYKKLADSTNAWDKKQAEKLKRKDYFYSYVYVIKDSQRPDLENTIQIFRYPKAIHKMILNNLQPTKEELEQGIEACNVFDLLEGKNFLVKTTIKSGYWNYDECKFLDKTMPLAIAGEKMTNSKESTEKFLALFNDAPAIEDHEYKPWTEEIQAKVFHYLSILTGSEVKGKDLDAVSKKPQTSEPTTYKAPVVKDDSVKSTKESTDVSTPELDEWLNEFNN